MRLLKEREELKHLRLTDLRQQIAIGAKEADCGEFVDGPRAFSEIRRRGPQRRQAKR